MPDQTKYNPLVAWSTIAANVSQLTRETEETPATYRMNVKILDTNEPGRGQKEAGFYFTDFIGNPYSIIAVDTNSIDVSDDFRTKVCPTSGRIGFIHKSAYKGRSLYLPSHSFRKLHPIAASNNNKYAMAILWSNDPNAKRIAFTDVEYPQISDWTADIVTTDGLTINPAEDYGNNPKLKIWIIEDGKEKESPLAVERTVDGDGNILSVVWGGIGENITGFIEISK